MSRPMFRFADFLLDPAARELRQGDGRVALPPKSLECLIYLVEHRERAVGRDELISAVWGRVDVSDALLAQTLLRARRAVGDTGNEQSSIRTVPRFGYQWVAVTQIVAPGTAPAPIEPKQAATRRHFVYPIAAALVLAMLLALWALRPAPGPSPATTADLLVVAPVELSGSDSDTAWIRLGVMDYIAARLRGAGLTVLPSERVAGLVAERGGESPAQLHQRLQRASGAGLLLQPQAAAQPGGGWRLRLDLVSAESARHYDGLGDSPLAAADQAVAALLAGLGRTAPATAATAARDPAAERLQRIDAAMLEGDLAEARALIAAADPVARRDPELRVREGQLAFRAGNLEAAQATFEALQAELDRLAPEVQAQALMGLGALDVRRGRYPDAEKRYAEALAVLGPDGRQDLAGNGYSGRGVARAAQGRFDLATADLARARIALERSGDAPGVASVDTNLGLLEGRSGKPALALNSFDRAIDVFGRYDVRDSLAASLLGKARLQLQLADNAASLATSRQAHDLARQLENPVLIRNVRQQLAEALLTNGRLAEAGEILAGLVAVPGASDDGVTTTRALHALETARPAQALDLLHGASRNDAGALLLEVRAVLAVGADPSRRAALASALADATATNEPALEQARALWADAAGDADGARRHFDEALRQADALGDASRRIDIVASWMPVLLHRRELDRATELAGQIAPHVDHDWRAARAAALYYRAIGDAHLQAAAEARLRGLAGERDATLP